MPKIKTHKSAAKRFRVTATGKITHRHTRRAHSMVSKSPGQKRRLYSEAIMDAGKNKVVGRQLANQAKS
jgi:large subunit ribosomal protein L35